MSLAAAFTRYLLAKVESGADVTCYELKRYDTGYVQPMYRLYCGGPYGVFLGSEDEATRMLLQTVETLRVIAERKAARLARQ
ncbi:hypothetical protein ACFVYV_09510 [Streptomyces mirabilis]|uniref:hypothetical protein n=1 Tax=Streptomyces mirabilis TaxID=68239 RepID=UPI0036D9DE72